MLVELFKRGFFYEANLGTKCNPKIFKFPITRQDIIFEIQLLSVRHFYY